MAVRPEAKEKDSNLTEVFEPTKSEITLFIADFLNQTDIGSNNKSCGVERKKLVLDLDETLLHTRPLHKKEKRIYKNKDVEPDFSFKVRKFYF